MSEKVFGCIGNTIKLLSGVYFDLASPNADLISIYDIAGALSKICRFGGHVPSFYSVAEHCALATRLAVSNGESVQACLAILLHDATEAYVGDMVKPLKVLVGSAYSEVEKQVEKVIGSAFSVDFDCHHEVIQRYDRAMLITEKHFFFSKDDVVWYGQETAMEIDIKFPCYAPIVAELEFIAMYEQLVHERNMNILTEE